MMKKKLFVLLTVVCILALATACGSQTSGTDTDSNAGTQSGAQQEESTLTGKLDEKKDFMFVVTDDQGASYQFSIDSSAKPEGYDDVAVGDSVTVTYTGALSEVVLPPLPLPQAASPRIIAAASSRASSFLVIFISSFRGRGLLLCKCHNISFLWPHNTLEIFLCPIYNISEIY